MIIAPAHPKYKFFADTDQGFLVAEVDISRDYFSITGELYPSRAAYEIGNENAMIAGGQLVDEILDNIKALRPFMHLHLCNKETGEPMHALANALYRLDPTKDFAHEMEGRRKGRKNYHIQGKDISWPRSEARDATEFEIIEHIVGIAARSLNVDVDELPDRLDNFGDYIESLRPRWKADAERFMAFLDEQPEPTLSPAEEDTEEFEHTFPNGLKVTSKMVDEVEASHVSYYALCYQYEVVVTWKRKKPHVAKFHGSIADYDNGHIDARGAAFGVLRELHEFGSDGAEDLYDAMEWAEDDPRRKECNALGARFIDGLEPNIDIIGI